ncbi:MAG: hypothetical protein LPK90_02565 [Alphaproteobacteria bacterium]|nr:hypothetical protein [Alphaproteobacteria bacterium]MDX5492380.1 hypothetical protein [Alphaproteobacteria bacterium]
MSEVDSIRDKVTPCWNARDLIPHPGLTEQVTATIRFSLDRDGSISEIEALPAPAHITDRNQRDFHAAMAESALSAVKNCAPYILPPEKYESWRKMTLNFNIATFGPLEIKRSQRTEGPLSDYDRKRIFGY